MAASPASTAAPAPSRTLLSRLDSWGSSSLPPMCLATLIGALHGRPFQVLPMLFTPALAFASYMNVAGYVISAGAMSAAWSGLYVLLALRRPQTMRQKLTTRGLVRGAAIGLGSLNCVAGLVTSLSRDRDQEAAERRARNRWSSGSNQA